MAAENLTGKVYGRLTVLNRLSSDKRGHARWLCKCECGNITTAFSTNLKSGHTLSCGCITKERMSTHGRSGSLEYQSWKCMIQRCTNPKHKHFQDYGGRGITVCDSWINSFENFFRDMGPRPDRYHSLDRIKVNEGYSKQNCRWATFDIQAKNKRHRVTRAKMEENVPF